MSVFRYTASDPGSGRVTRGQLTADSPVQVRAALRRMGLSPVRVAEERVRQHVASGAAREFFIRLMRDRRRGRLVEFYESLSALLESGTPLTESLDLLSRTTRSGTFLRRGGSDLGTIARSLAESIRGGGSLADSMSGHADWFGPIDAALVRSSEQSGELARIMTDLATHHDRSDELRGRFVGALAYPALLLVFGMGVVVFLTTKTLPQLSAVLSDSGVALPRTTAALLAFGGALTEHWPWIVPLMIGISLFLIYTSRRPGLARMRLRLPLLGPAVMRSQVGSASLLIARLLDCGLPLTEALALAAPTIPNAALRGAYTDLHEQLQDGASITALGNQKHSNPQHRRTNTGLFEPVYLRVLEIGEQRGDLSAALHRIGTRYRASAARLIDRISAALEPAAILLMAAMIGFVVYAAIIPMTRLGQAL